MRRLQRKDSFEDLFDQMEEFFQQFQEMGRDITGLETGLPVDIQEEDGKYILSADMPGVNKEEIDIKADEDSVEITAESDEEIKEENEKYVRRERSSRTFRRKVMWPGPVETDSIEANYDNGVLKVSAEKQEDAGREIEVE
ncbi:MAG: Hsp20/alpha crystallin family protein [Candidatus Nanohaloarchaea archaeon]